VGVRMPEGRVLVAGGGRDNGRSQPDSADQPSSEYYSPPYLFKGARPVITSAPSVITYGSTFSVVTPDASRIASVSMIPLGAVTHAFNQTQRYVPVAFDKLSGSINVHAPADGNTAPPGMWMLFLVDTNGVPSVAAIIRLPVGAPDSIPPSAPGNLSANPGFGSVALSWFASTDNVGVTAYNVYRSTTTGFTPSPANKIGTTSSTTYTDTAISASGTYYYLVTAQDAAGNVSPPPSEAPARVTVDTTAPTVSIPAPSTGATVSGVINITANATDNVAVAGVQFLLDGANLGAEVTGPGPSYVFAWTT